MPDTIDDTKGGLLTFEQICIACKNIGIDLACGGCAANFFTGFNDCPHDEHCTATSPKTVRCQNYRRHKMTEQDFASKIEWEGGITEALDYGLKSVDCEPGALHNAWKKLETKWAGIQKEMDTVQNILDEYSEEEDEEEEG